MNRVIDLLYRYPFSVTYVLVCWCALMLVVDAQ